MRGDDPGHVIVPDMALDRVIRLSCRRRARRLIEVEVVPTGKLTCRGRQAVEHDIRRDGISICLTRAQYRTDWPDVRGILAGDHALMPDRDGLAFQAGQTVFIKGFFRRPVLPSLRAIRIAIYKDSRPANDRLVPDESLIRLLRMNRHRIVANHALTS